MKLLLDQNLSWRLVRELKNLFPESKHVREASLDQATDDDVWDHARREGYMIVSKDSDFQQRSMLYGTPPKCLWIRVGNCTTDDIRDLIIKNATFIKEFADRDDESYLILP